MATYLADNVVCFSSSRSSGASTAFPGDNKKFTAVRASTATIRIVVVHTALDLSMVCGPFFLMHLFHQGAL